MVLSLETTTETLKKIRAWESTEPHLTTPGSAALMKTGTGCCGSSFPRAWCLLLLPSPTLTEPCGSSTTGRANGSGMLPRGRFSGLVAIHTRTQERECIRKGGRDSVAAPRTRTADSASEAPVFQNIA